MQSLARLGDPDYLATILGVAKLLGVAAVLVPRLPRLVVLAIVFATWALRPASRRLAG